MSTAFVIRLTGIFLGVAARSLVPWLRKLRDGRPVKFGRRYFVSMLASLILCFIVTLAVFPDLAVPAAVPGAGPFEAMFRLFCVAFGFGFGFNAIVLEGEQWFETERRAAARKAAGKAVPPGTDDIKTA